MSEEKTEYFTQEELKEMFENGFLRILHAISNRKKASDKNFENCLGFSAHLQCIFPADIEELNMGNLERLQLNLRPLMPTDEAPEKNVSEN